MSTLTLGLSALPSRKPTVIRKQKKAIKASNLGSLTIPEQVSAAFSRQHRISSIAGAILGGAIPAGTWYTVHHSVAGHPWLWSLVAGGLAYSAPRVFTWAQEALKDAKQWSAVEAAGFTLLCEGLMSFSPNHLVSLAFLSILVAINAISAAVSIQAK